MLPDGIRQFIQGFFPENLPGLGRIWSDGADRKKNHPSRFHVRLQLLALHCPSSLKMLSGTIVGAFSWENRRKPKARGRIMRQIPGYGIKKDSMRKYR
jgi:hypothetical protein